MFRKRKDRADFRESDDVGIVWGGSSCTCR